MAPDIKNIWGVHQKCVLFIMLSDRKFGEATSVLFILCTGLDIQGGTKGNCWCKFRVVACTAWGGVNGGWKCPSERFSNSVSVLGCWLCASPVVCVLRRLDVFASNSAGREQLLASRVPGGVLPFLRGGCSRDNRIVM